MKKNPEPISSSLTAEASPVIEAFGQSSVSLQELDDGTARLTMDLRGADAKRALSAASPLPPADAAARAVLRE